MEIYESGRKNIVILGAGFGGITALITLCRLLRRRHQAGAYQIVLVNRTNHHLYTPALYEIAAIPPGEGGGTGLKATVCIPLDAIVQRFPGVRLIGEEAIGLNPQTHAITFSSGNVLNFDYALVALGAETNFSGIPGLAEHAFPLKTFADALSLRNRVEELARREGDFKIIVAGGGATGVEFSAELVNYICYLKERARGGKCREEITLVEAAEILPGFSAAIVRRARRRLEKLGIRIMTASAISRVSAALVSLRDGRALPYHLLVWAGGVRPASALRNFGLALDRRDGILVNEYLQARPDVSASARRVAVASDRIYAIGDNASFTKPRRGAALPWNVPVAESQARIAAKNIASAINHEPLHPFRPLSRYPFILAVGGKYALSDLLLLKFSGFVGWVVKQLVELRYLAFILPWRHALRVWLRAVYYSTRND